MFLRFLTLLLAAFALAGCILQSDAPLFAETDGVAALKPLGETFVTYNLVNGQWQAEKERAVFKPVGQHYEVPGDSSGTVSVTFVALEKNAWVMQAAEASKPAAYIIARRDGNALLLQVPVCEELKKDPTYAKRFRFDRDDCFAPAGFSIADFRTLAKALPPSRIKMEAAP